MELPRELGSLKDLKNRAGKAKSQEVLWEDTLNDVYDYFLPQRNIFDDEAPGQHKMDRIFDSTPLEAIQQGASKLQESIAPIWSRWAKPEVPKRIKSFLEANESEVSLEDVQQYLDKQNEILFDYIHRSNFGTQFYEMALDVLVGTGTLKIDEQDDDESPLVFNSIPQRGIAFEEAPHGSIETHWREFKVCARNLERTWKGFKPSEEIADLIAREPETKVQVTEGVVYEPKGKKYYGVVWVKGEEQISWLYDFKDSSPFVTGRYAKCSGEIRGRGPALQALPDAKSLNKAKEFSLQKAAIDLAGMWTATDDGVVNPYNITVAPGVVIPVGSNNSANPSLMRLDTNSSLQLSEFVISDLQMAIKRALFNDLRDPNGPVRSATEVSIEAREIAKRIGSAYGRLQTEILIPTLQRVHWILKRRGLIEPMEVGGMEVEYKFTSPLAVSQDMEDLMAVQQAVEFTMATAGPAQAQMAFRLEDFGSWAGRKTGMTSELLRTEEEKKQVIEAGAQAAMAGGDTGEEPVARQQQPLRSVT